MFAFFRKLLGIEEPSTQQSVKPLGEALNEACYLHILGHLDRYKAEEDPERWVPLMAPEHYAGFASQALDDVAAVIGQQMRDAWGQAAGHRPQDARPLEQLRPTARALASVRDSLAGRLEPFGEALRSYAPHHERFNRLLGEAHLGALRQGGEWGYAGAEIGEGLFGTVGAIFGSVLGGILAGNNVQKQLDAENEQVQRVFQGMLKAYDAAMASLCEAAAAGLERYDCLLVEAVGAGDVTSPDAAWAGTP